MTKTFINKNKNTVAEVEKNGQLEFKKELFNQIVSDQALKE